MGEIAITLWVCTNKIGSKMERTIKIDKKEWEEMGKVERGEYVWDSIQNLNMIEWGWSEEDV